MTLTSKKTEVAFNGEWLGVLFSHLSEKDILIGDQALIFWAGKYGLMSFDHPVMTNDADLLSPFDAVSRLSGELNAIAIYPAKKGFGTALYGQIEIHLNSKEYLNIDILREPFGVDSQSVIKRAIKNNNFFVMNPIDVFVSKITNYARLESKQDSNGKLQAELSVQVIKKFTEDMVSEGKIKEAVSIAQTIFKLGRSSIGKGAIKMGVNPFDGILFDIPDDQFQKEWVPRAKYQICLALSGENDSSLSMT